VISVEGSQSCGGARCCPWRSSECCNESWDVSWNWVDFTESTPSWKATPVVQYDGIQDRLLKRVSGT